MTKLYFLLFTVILLFTVFVKAVVIYLLSITLFDQINVHVFVNSVCSLDLLFCFVQITICNQHGMLVFMGLVVFTQSIFKDVCSVKIMIKYNK